MVMRLGLIYNLTDRLDAEVSLGYNTVNLDQDKSYGQYSTRISYFELPVGLRYRIAGPVYLSGGVSLGLPSQFSVSDRSYRENVKSATLFYTAGIHVDLDERMELVLRGLYGTEKLVSYQEIGPFGELSEPQNILQLRGIQLSLRINLIFLEK